MFSLPRNESRRARWSGRIGFLAAFTAAVLTLSYTPANATSSASSPDGGANGLFRSDHPRPGGGDWERFVLDDVKCDSHAVYIVYNIGDGGDHRFDNTQGCNTPALGLNLDVREGVDVDWKVCTNIQLGGDSCSVWIDDET